MLQAHRPDLCRCKKWKVEGGSWVGSWSTVKKLIVETKYNPNISGGGQLFSVFNGISSEAENPIESWIQTEYADYLSENESTYTIDVSGKYSQGGIISKHAISLEFICDKYSGINSIAEVKIAVQCDFKLQGAAIFYKWMLIDFSKLSTISALPSWNINIEKAIMHAPMPTTDSFLNNLIERLISAVTIKKTPNNKMSKYQNPIKIPHSL